MPRRIMYSFTVHERMPLARRKATMESSRYRGQRTCVAAYPAARAKSSR